MSGRIQVERLDYDSGWPELEPEWEALLKDSENPSIFSTYDYVTISLRHFCESSEPFLLLFRDGDSGDLLAVLHSDGDQTKIEAARKKLLAAYSFTSDQIDPPKLLYARITKHDVEEF